MSHLQSPPRFDHKRRLAQLERDNRRLLADADKRRKLSAGASEGEVESARVTAKMIRSIRGKLKLSQAGLAKLLGVNPQTVYQWEHKEGRLTFRDDAKTRIVEVRKLNAREAEEKLAEIA